MLAVIDEEMEGNGVGKSRRLQLAAGGYGAGERSGSAAEMAGGRIRPSRTAGVPAGGRNRRRRSPETEEMSRWNGDECV